MLILGIETSCDETGVALYDDSKGLLAQALHSQVVMHQDYGGVVPELASRDHIRRVPLLLGRVLADARCALEDLDGVAYTAGPGLAGALLVGASVAHGLAFSLGVPAIPVHHLEGHLLAPFLSGFPLEMPFVALLVSGGHTQLMRVGALGRYELLGETLDDAAGEAFDKTAQLLSLGYPGGPALSRLAMMGHPARFHLPRPMLHTDDLNLSFSGLKTAVLTALRKQSLSSEEHADLAAEFQEAIVDVLVAKSLLALERTGTQRLVVAGGVGANQRLRQRLDAAANERGLRVIYPPMEYCTDNGAMIAFAGALRMTQTRIEHGFGVRPRWDLTALPPI